MVIAEGETSNYVDGLLDMELAFVNTSIDDSLEYTVFDAPLLKEGSAIRNDKLNIEIKIIKFIENVRIENRPPAEPIYKGFLEDFIILPKQPEKEATQNRPGIVIKLSGLGDEKDGIYALFLGQKDPDTFLINGDLFYRV